MMIRDWFKYSFCYAFKCFFFLPVTFVRRVILGKEELPKQFFRQRWGILPGGIKEFSAGGNIWVVANSGGEVNQAFVFLKKLKSAYPGKKLLLSTESYDTFEYARKINDIDFVFFLPWDIPCLCRKVVKAVSPGILIFIEHCYFPVLARSALKFKVPVAMCSARIDLHFLKDNYLLKRSFALGFFSFMTVIAVKGISDADNLRKLGMESSRVVTAGDMRLDLEHIVLTEKRKTSLKAETGFKNDDPVFIVGSVHAKEAGLITDAFKKARSDISSLKLILAPRWMNETAAIEKIISDSGFTSRRRSEAGLSSGGYDVLILDTFGELPYFYGLADVAFIASSIVENNSRKLGHNIFEPLAHGIAVLFGPNMHSWQEVVAELQKVWPECRVSDSVSLAGSLRKLLSDKGLYSRLSDAALSLSRLNSGIANRHLDLIKGLVPGERVK